MEIINSKILQDIKIINLPTFDDERGFFREVFHQNELDGIVGHPVKFVRLNHARSKKNVLRGIHVAPFEKLVYVTSGQALVAIVDCRPESANFGRYELFELGDDNRIALFIPAGFGNSYYTRSATADYVYLVTEYYDPAREQTIRWNDPDIKITWPSQEPIISERDKNGISLSSIAGQSGVK